MPERGTATSPCAIGLAPTGASFVCNDGSGDHYVLMKNDTSSHVNECARMLII